ncbi:MAG: hypothetical protein J5548_03100 [Prevotella sp.]|jgi:hypothetical protein|nr:hypothetical protein [Prevotella sp.]
MTLTHFLLDIAPDPGSNWTRRPRIIKPDVVEDHFEQAKDSFLIVRDSLLNLEKNATDTVSNMQSSGFVGTGDDNSSMLLLTALAVMAALALCVALALTYRRRLTHA